MTSYSLPPASSLTCLFGTPWMEHWLGPLFACVGCEAETARLRAAARGHARP